MNEQQQTSTAVTTRQGGAVAVRDDSVKGLLSRDDFKKRFEEILGARSAQFVASVINLSRDQNMADVEPMSMIGSAVVAATLDLPVDKNLGFAWIVPYREKGKPRAQFQIGWKGIVQLALRTGQYSRMSAGPLNKEALGGFDSVGEPVILWDKLDPAKPPIGYFFAWKLVNGFEKLCYWSKERVQAHAAKYSMAYRNKKGPWVSHFDQMAIKTVVKNELSDWGILSIEMRTAMRHDQGVKSSIEVDSAVTYPDQEGKRPMLEGPSPDDIPTGGDWEHEQEQESHTDKPDPSTATSTAATIDAAASTTPPVDPATIEKPFEFLQGLCKRDGVTEKQVHAFMKAKKLCGEKTEELAQAADSKMLKVIEEWPTVLPAIKATEAK